jgi:hypothetical protein
MSEFEGITETREAGFLVLNQKKHPKSKQRI